VDVEATKAARTAERQRRLAQARPYNEWESEWLERRPPARVLNQYGSWPNGLETPLFDTESTEELLDDHVREGGAPRMPDLVKERISG
jgi:hypothetical protein